MYGTNGRLKRSPELAEAGGMDTFGDRAFVDAARDMNALTGDLQGMHLSDRQKGARMPYRRRYAQMIKTSPADAVSFLSSTYRIIALITVRVDFVVGLQGFPDECRHG